MRIIAGYLKRKSIKAPRGTVTRPSTDRTRESLFNLVESRLDLEDADVLDLFAGTGALGFEAISRGAKVVTFVETYPAAVKSIRYNAGALEVSDHCIVIRSDAVSYIERYKGPPFDLILADPPYELEMLARLPELAIPHLKSGGLFVLEHDVRHSFVDHPDLAVSRPYGRTIVSIFSPDMNQQSEG